MEPIKVAIDNWQSNPWYLDFVPLFVGVLALIVSLYTIYLSRKQFRISTRPYITASNFWDINIKQQINESFIFTVTNSAAKVISMDLKMYFKEDVVERKEHNLTRIPVDGSTWAYRFADSDYKKLKQLSINEPGSFFRSVSIIYSSLGGGKKYKTELVQNFIGPGETWQNVSEHMD